METQVIKDRASAPVAVIIDYQDWIDIKRQLKLVPRETDVPENPLDWYTLTETTNAILNELIAYTGREELKELEKPHPDTKRIDELQSLFKELDALNREPDNFTSASRMREIISQYAPMLRAAYQAA